MSKSIDVGFLELFKVATLIAANTSKSPADVMQSFIVAGGATTSPAYTSAYHARSKCPPGASAFGKR